MSSTASVLNTFFILHTCFPFLVTLLACLGRSFIPVETSVIKSHLHYDRLGVRPISPLLRPSTQLLVCSKISRRFSILSQIGQVLVLDEQTHLSTVYGVG